jgi:hypothetical protein
LHLFLFFHFLDHFKLLLLLLVNFSIDFSQLLTESSGRPVQVVMLVESHLVVPMLLVRVKVGFQVTGYRLADVAIIVQLLMLLEDPATVLVYHAAS